MSEVNLLQDFYTITLINANFTSLMMKAHIIIHQDGEVFFLLEDKYFRRNQ